MKFMLSQRSFSRYWRTWGSHCSPSLAHYLIPITRPAFRRKLSTTPPETNASQQAEYVGQTGRIYTVHSTIGFSPQNKLILATSDDGQRFVLKHLEPENLNRYQIANDCLKDSDSRFRLLKDVIPSESMIVCEHFNTSLYHTIQGQRRLPLDMVKKILKSALNFLAELHDRNVVYGVFGPRHILLDLTKDQGRVTLNRVQLAHSFDTVYLPRGSNILRREVGPWQWRSPESSVFGPVNKPSDIFSFALLCVFAVRRKRVLLNHRRVQNHVKSDTQISILKRQMSYFADRKGVEGFVKYLGKEHPLIPMIQLTWDGLLEGNSCQPWKSGLKDFQNLIHAMTNFDPSKRITARQALQHKWFEDVEVVQQDDRPEKQESDQDSSLVFKVKK
ncbi:kinase-like domain-containing protein [Aspergillus carlsbadensis]|nr:kinase-like domain-containing protein [Aspergillus carlsbadensis]